MIMDLYKVREVVFLFLYSFDMGTQEHDELIELLKEECKVSRSFVEHALQRAQTVVRSLARIDELLQQVSISYSLDRLHSVERNILRLAIFEMALEKEIPPKVVLSEARRLSKKFSTEDAAIFVQTLLLAVCRAESIEIEKAEG